MVKGHIWENKSYTSLIYLIYLTMAWNFVFRKLEFDTIYYAYLNKSPFKYYISILGGVGGPEFWKTCLYNTFTLPKRSIVTFQKWHQLFMWSVLCHGKYIKSDRSWGNCFKWQVNSDKIRVKIQEWNVKSENQEWS